MNFQQDDFKDEPNPYRKDQLFGDHAEVEVMDSVMAVVGSSIQRTAWYDKVDFKGLDVEVELKRRRCSSTAYPDTMITQGKIEHFKAKHQEGIRTFIFIWFTDGLYFLEFKPVHYTAIRQNESGGRSDRGKNERRPTGYAYIPIRLLRHYT